MKNIYLVSYKVEACHYMSDSKTSDVKIRAVWALSEEATCKMLTEDIESQGSPCSVSYYVQIEEVEIALGSP